MTPDPAAQVAAIRARHQDCERHSGGPWTEGQALAAHADRATLLALLDRAGEEVDTVRRGMEGAIDRAEQAEAEAARLRGALMKIKTDYGHVCGGYELCQHESCRSSYGAWSLADEALRGPDAEVTG